MQGVRQQSGFTLVELVAVIVLLGVIGAATTQFISASINIFNDSSRRGALSQMGRFTVERISREIRNALPGSVRVAINGGVQCIEFTPIIAGSSYLDTVAELPAVSSIEVVDFPYNYNAGDRVAVYTLDNSDVYGAATAAIAQVASVGAAVGDRRLITLSAANRFPNESPVNRLYMIDGPVSFCARDGVLTRYQGYAPTAAQSVPPGSGGVQLADDIRISDADGNAVDVFRYLAGTLRRAGTVHMDLHFSDNRAADEWVQFSQEVSLRNSP